MPSPPSGQHHNLPAGYARPTAARAHGSKGTSLLTVLLGVALLGAVVISLVSGAAALGILTRFPVERQGAAGIEATPTPLSPAQRLRLFEQVWQIVDTEYVYTDFHGLDWQGIHEEYTPKIQGATSDRETYGLLSEMVERLGDEHSGFYAPPEAAAITVSEHGDERLVGIGIFWHEYDGVVRLRYIVPDSPAAQAGLRPDDRLVAIDGTPIHHTDEVARVLSGPAGTPVMLTVATAAETPRNLTITRAEINYGYHALAQRLPGTNIAYLNMPTFDVRGITREAQDQLARLAVTGPLDGLVIDLREDSGGFIKERDELLRLFLDGGSIGYVATRQGRTLTTIRGGGTLAALRDKPLVVLVNQESVSASETFAAAMQSRHRATILGTTTAGNTEITYGYDLLYGTELRLAQARYLQLDGTSLEDVGLKPDVVLDVDWYAYPLESDPQVVRAMQIIQTH